MNSMALASELLRRSGLSKTELSARSGISRSLLDGYLKGSTAPSLPQLHRLAQGADLGLEVHLREGESAQWAAFESALRFSESQPPRPVRPLADLAGVWGPVDA